MELKYRIRGITITLLNSSNRTFMELKLLTTSKSGLVLSIVLIVPLWN